MKNDCYFELPVEDYIEPRLYTLAKSDLFPMMEYFGFTGKLVPNEVLLEDPIYNAIYQEQPFNAGIIRIPPNTCYDWHKDAERGVTINCILTPNGHSHCLFAPDRDEQLGKNGSFSFDTIELDYKPGRRYVFNNQVWHSVVNFDKPRWLLTLEFVNNKSEFNYKDMLTLLRRVLGN